MLPQDRLCIQADRHADYCAKAHAWGKEDAINGIHPRGAEYFIIAGRAWNAYLEGYSVGLQLRKVDADPDAMSELEFMDYVLETLRNGSAPVTRLTEEQLAEIEAERPGEDFSLYPFLY